MSTPDPFHIKFDEATLQQTLYGFRYKSLSPIRNTYPISYFCISILHIRTVYAISEHNSDTAYRFIGFFQYYSVCLGCRKDIAYYFSAVFHRCMRRPPGNGADSRIFGIIIKRLCIVVANT